MLTTCDTSPSTTSPRNGCHTTARYEIVYIAMPVPGITLGSLISKIPMMRTIIIVPVFVPSFFLYSSSRIESGASELKYEGCRGMRSSISWTKNMMCGWEARERLRVLRVKVQGNGGLSMRAGGY